MQAATIGPDVAKRVFQAHGVDAAGQAAVRMRLRRSGVLASLKSRRRPWSASGLHLGE